MSDSRVRHRTPVQDRPPTRTCRQTMNDDLSRDNQKQSLAEYLKGALASHHIVNTGKKINCEDCPQPEKDGGLLVLVAPKVVVADQICDLRLRINNPTNGAFSGTILLSGSGNIRRRAYEFTAPFHFSVGERAFCLAFQWHAPDYPTHIEWSVTLQGYGQMGLSVSRVSETVVVKELRSATVE